MVLEAGVVSLVAPIVTSRGNEGNCRPTSDAVLVARYLTPLILACLNPGFKRTENNSTTIQPIYNESENLIDSCDVAFDTSDWWNVL